jgi:Zn-dependent M28 family amino/carboxypeptidase
VSRPERILGANVAGLLPGADPALGAEAVVFVAHLDHMGIGDPVDGDAIYNGALDDAAGVASLLEIARALRALPTPPRRSFLFLVVDGEEKGLLGAYHFTRRPTFPLASIAAVLAIDVPSMFFDFGSMIALGAEHSTLGRVVEEVLRRQDLVLQPDPNPEELGFIRSDQYPFIQQGVPALWIVQGDQPVDPKVDLEKLMTLWGGLLHSPKDDPNAPLDYSAGAKGARVILSVGYQVAQETARPGWTPGSFFQKRFAKAAPLR